MHWSVGFQSIIFLLWCCFAPPVHAEKRLALVIGNASYVNAPRLENPKNDARDVAAALERLNFQVFLGLDLDKQGFDSITHRFAGALRGASVGLFFYAGHGLQVSGQNYLVPVDAQLSNPGDLDFETVRLDVVQRSMEREAKTNIMFLDACRDNPLGRNLARAMGTRSVDIGRGLSAVESGEGTLVSFSTQPGNVALDGRGRNSPFSAALLRHMQRPDLDLSAILINVRNDVMAQTARRQVPWEHSALTARFFFMEPVASPDQEAELRLWASVKDSGDASAVRAYISKYPRGVFAAVAETLVAALERSNHRQSEQKAPKLPEAVHPFDGVWRVEFIGGKGCKVKSNVGSWMITEGTLPDRGYGLGRVSQAGELKWKSPSIAVPNLAISYVASLTRTRGDGTYSGGGCHGSMSLTRQ